MASAEIGIEGLSGVVAALGRLDDAAATAGGAELEVFSPVPWAFGLETGRTPRGRLARRAGGAYMFRQGADDGLAGVDRELAAALAGGPPAVAQTYLAAGRRTVEAVRRRTPRVTGYTASTVTMRLTVGGR
jgi:hypothetical protein